MIDEYEFNLSNMEHNLCLFPERISNDEWVRIYTLHSSFYTLLMILPSSLKLLESYFLGSYFIFNISTL